MDIKASIIKSNLKHFGQFPEVYVVNPDENIWNNHYLVCIDYFSVYYVIADYEQSALDILVDYLEDNNCQGYFYTDKEIEEFSDQEREELLVAGNHSRYIHNDVLVIEQL